MKVSPQIASQMATLIQCAIKEIQNHAEEEVITDFHIQPNVETGEVTVFDDNDTELSKTTVEGCEELDKEEFTKLVSDALSKELNKLKEKNAFDSLNLFRPFSFVLVDDDKETVRDLLVVDSDTVTMSGDELLKGLDKELDDFINNLLADE
jgi:hypothetical protein